MPEPFSYAPGCTVLADGSVVFVYDDASASSVLVAGEFTGWAKSPLTLRRLEGRLEGSSLWTAQSEYLPKGTYHYKFVVDGRWIADPANRLAVDDGLGGRNSAFVTGRRDLGDSRAVRVLSLNLHTYQEKNERGQNDALAKLEKVAFGVAVGEIDVLLLQEVGEHVQDPARPNAGWVLQQHLERFTGKPWFHEWREAHIGFDVYREGLSILACRPLEDVTMFQLSDAPLARIALFANVETKGAKIRVGTTHVGWGSEGGEHVKKLLSLLKEKRASDCSATLVVGDFNADADEPQVALMVDAGYSDVGVMRKATFLTFGDGNGDKPRGLDRRIDYHFLRATAGRGAPRVDAFLRVFDGQGLDDGLSPRVSDHAGIVAAYSWDSR